MRERNLSQRILKNSNIVKWSRVESKTSPGIPDLHGFFADPKDHVGYTFWLELRPSYRGAREYIQDKGARSWLN